MIIENGHVTHNCKLGVFTVLGTTGNPHAVQLFPKETCTCPSTGLCYHIMAVRMSIGIDQQKSLSKVDCVAMPDPKRIKHREGRNQGWVIMISSPLQIPYSVKKPIITYVEYYV